MYKIHTYNYRNLGRPMGELGWAWVGVYIFVVASVPTGFSTCRLNLDESGIKTDTH